MKISSGAGKAVKKTEKGFSKMHVNIREAHVHDGEAIAEIYNYFVSHTHITFETQSVTANEMRERIARSHSHSFPWLVATGLSNNVVGYAYAAPWKARAAYEKSVEVSIYMSVKEAGKGIGHALYSQLFDNLRKQQVHTVLAGISLPNDASVAFHEAFGMEKVAQLREVGRKHGKWIDVGYWQGIL